MRHDGRVKRKPRYDGFVGNLGRRPRPRGRRTSAAAWGGLDPGHFVCLRSCRGGAMCRSRRCCRRWYPSRVSGPFRPERAQHFWLKSKSEVNNTRATGWRRGLFSEPIRGVSAPRADLRALTSSTCMCSLVCLSSKPSQEGTARRRTNERAPVGLRRRISRRRAPFINTRRGCPSPAPALRKQTQEATTSTSSAARGPDLPETTGAPANNTLHRIAKPPR